MNGCINKRWKPYFSWCVFFSFRVSFEWFCFLKEGERYKNAMVKLSLWTRRKQIDWRWNIIELILHLFLLQAMQPWLGQLLSPCWTQIEEKMFMRNSWSLPTPTRQSKLTVSFVFYFIVMLSRMKSSGRSFNTVEDFFILFPWKRSRNLNIKEHLCRWGFKLARIGVTSDSFFYKLYKTYTIQQVRSIDICMKKIESDHLRIQKNKKTTP